MKVIKSETDNRGSVVIIEDEGWEYHIVKTFAGKYRGGEIHDGDQFNFVVRGDVKFIFSNSTTASRLDYVLALHEGMGTSIIPPGLAHMSQSLTDSIVLEWHKAGRKTEYYEPFREKVRNQ